MKFSPIVAALGAAALIVGVAVGPDEARSEDQFTIGVAVWDVSTTPFAVPLVKGMRDAAEAANVNLIVSDPKWDASAPDPPLRPPQPFRWQESSSRAARST